MRDARALGDFSRKIGALPGGKARKSSAKRAWIAALAALACLAALAAPRAEAAVYWGGISAANLDGSEPNSAYFNAFYLGPGSAGFACGLAATPDYLYWGGTWGIGRVNLAGPATPQTIVGPLPVTGPHPRFCNIAVDSAHVYWADHDTGAIGRSNVDGSEPNLALVSGLEEPCGVAVAGDHVYWVDRHGVGRARLDGSEPEPAFMPGFLGGCGLASDGTYIYWDSGNGPEGAIGRARLDGTEQNAAFLTGLGGVGAIAVDAAHLYWTDLPNAMAYATIGRADISGAAPNRNWIATDTFNPNGLAVDARPTPLPLPLPSRPIYFGKLRHNVKAGLVALDVRVPARGELVVSSPAIGWTVLKGDPPPYAQGSFRWRLKVWPGKRGKVAARVRRQLHRKGRARVVLHLSYNETGQLPVTVTKAVTLIKHRRSPRS